MIKKTASLSSSSDNSKTRTEENKLEKFAILIHHFDDYIVNTESRLSGDSFSTVKQLETLGYNVISINPNRWLGMAVSSAEEKSLFLKQQLGGFIIDDTLQQGASCKDT